MTRPPADSACRSRAGPKGASAIVSKHHLLMNDGVVIVSPEGLSAPSMHQAVRRAKGKRTNGFPPNRCYSPSPA